MMLRHDPPAEHRLPARRRHGVRGSGLLQPRLPDSHPQHGPPGSTGHALHRHALAVRGVHADPLWPAHRPLLLAQPAQGGGALQLRAAADRAGAADRGVAAGRARLPHGLHRQVAPGSRLGSEGGRALLAAGARAAVAEPAPAGRRGGQDRLHQADHRRAAGAGLRPLLRHFRVRHRAAPVRFHRRRPHGGDPLAAQGRNRAGRPRRPDGAGLAAQGGRSDLHPPSTPVPGGARRGAGHAFLPVPGRIGAARAMHRERGAGVCVRQERSRVTRRHGVAGTTGWWAR